MGSRRLLVLAMSLCVASPALAASIDERKENPRLRRVEDRRVRPVRPQASVALQAVNDCNEARELLIEVGIERVLEYRYGNFWWGTDPWSGAEDGAGGSTVPTDYTTTNNQEQGVDEIDIVKTNGTHIFTVEEESLHGLSSWPAESTHEIAAVEAPDYAHGLFLRDDRVVIASRVWYSEEDFAFERGGTRLLVLDISTPESPVVVRTIDLEGWLSDARLIDGHLYAVLQSTNDLPPEIWDLAWSEEVALPDLEPDASEEERDRVLARAREILEPLVVEIMSRYEVASFLPWVRDQRSGQPDAEPEPLVGCSSLYAPAQPSTWSLLTTVHFDLDTDGPLSAVGLAAEGWTVYASAQSLYVAQTSQWLWDWFWSTRGISTTIHKFVLDPASSEPVRYAASGEVSGWALDQFAMSEYDGYLRVATTEFDWWWGTTEDEEQASSVTVLEDDGSGVLMPVGHVGGLGPGERIFAVRFLGDVGFVVTFEQIDPLFTLDLSDPTSPEVLGELEVTGFSSYLHPIGDEWLLAVGQEADENGRLIGLAVSVFDVRDLTDPRLAHRYLIEGDDQTWSWSEALNDHHAFTYHRGVLSFPIYVWSDDQRFSGLVVLAVDPQEGITELGRIDHSGLGTGEHPPRVRRSIYIEDRLFSISSAGVKVNDLYQPEIEIAAVPFKE